METGGDRVKIIDEKGGIKKKIMSQRGDQTFLLHRLKKNQTGTFDAATRTTLHFSRVDQGYLSCYFYLKKFKNKKDFRIQIVRQILTHFFQKKGRIINFHMIDLFTSALSDCQNAFSILCEGFNSIEEVTLSIVRELRSSFCKTDTPEIHDPP